MFLNERRLFSRRLQCRTYKNCKGSTMNGHGVGLLVENFSEHRSGTPGSAHFAIPRSRTFSRACTGTHSQDQAYGVRKWHGRTGSSTLTLFPIKRQLTWKESIRLRRRFEKDASALIDGRRVRLIERQSAILTPDSGRKVSFTKAHLLNECLRGMK